MSEELLGTTSYVHPNLKLLSYSSISLLHSCPRKFELYRLGQKANVADMWTELDGEDAVPAVAMEGNVHFDFGSLVGDATQHYLVHGDLEATIFYMFTHWGRPLEDEADRGKKGKSFYHAVYAVQKFVQFRQSALAQWDVAKFNNIPATELGYTIDCGDGFISRGFLDALLVNKLTGSYAVYEGKTTGAYKIDEAMYRNSGQGLAYDLVLETISGEQQDSYPVFYSVYSTNKLEWILFPFPKTKLGRSWWIKNLLIDKTHISEYAEWGHFPMHGESCFSYNKPCQYFGECERTNQSLGLFDIEPKVEDESKFTFKFSLEDIINKQLEKVGGVSGEI